MYRKAVHMRLNKFLVFLNPTLSAVTRDLLPTMISLPVNLVPCSSLSRNQVHLAEVSLQCDDTVQSSTALQIQTGSFLKQEQGRGIRDKTGY